MKKVFLSIAATLMVASVSLASEVREVPGPDFDVTKSGSLLKVFYKSDKQENVTVSIFASDGRIFSEVLKDTKGFLRPYNISDLPQGAYVVEVFDGLTAYREHVVIAEERKSGSIDIAKVAGENQKILIRVGKGSGGYNVKISDEYGRVLFREGQDLQDDFAKVYDLGKLKGNVSIEVTDMNGNKEKFSL